VVAYIGAQRYAELARTARRLTLAIAAGVGEIDGLRVVVPPDATLLALTTTGTDCDVFTLADGMQARGWYLQPQFAFGPSPANLHLTVTAALDGQEQALLADLRAAVGAARAAGPVTVADEIAAFVSALDPDALTGEQFGGLLAAAGLGTEAGRSRSGWHRSTPCSRWPRPRLRERLTTEFYSRLQVPVAPAEAGWRDAAPTLRS
jgi:sphinganine-1-phosphate aldolase